MKQRKSQRQMVTVCMKMGSFNIYKKNKKKKTIALGEPGDLGEERNMQEKHMITFSNKLPHISEWAASTVC